MAAPRVRQLHHLLRRRTACATLAHSPWAAAGCGLAFVAKAHSATPGFGSLASTGNQVQVRRFGFYDRTVQKWADRPIPPLALNKLFERAETREGLLQGCQFVHEQLTVRIARRIAKIHEVPYIVGINPHIQTVYSMYVNAFQRLAQYKAPTTFEEERVMTEQLFEDLMAGTRALLPTIAKASKEISTFMDTQELNEFVDTMIQGRISRRILMENHLYAHKNVYHPERAQQEGGTADAEDYSRSAGANGVIVNNMVLSSNVKNTFARVKEICLHTYGQSPDLIISGPECANFSYIPAHINYILMELFKNAARATVEHRRNSEPDSVGDILPPIEVSLYRGSQDVTIKIRDKGGGIPPGHLDSVYNYAFSTIDAAPYNTDNEGASPWPVDDLGGRPIAGEGFGLPMVRVYAKYFGGDLSFQSLSGHGTDVYLRLSDLDTNLVRQLDSQIMKSD